MMTIQENVSLLPFNTFHIAAKARFFVEITSIDELQKVLALPAYQNVKKLILGGGSNVLFINDFYDGLVIKIAISGMDVVQETAEHVKLGVGAGVVWHDLVLFCLQNGYAGIENLSLIPGTVGAAPMQNIGAYGIELKEVFDSLEAVHITTGTLRSFSKTECRFGYRESVFKHELKDQYIITKVYFTFSKTPVFNVSYGAIADTLREMNVQELSIRAVSEAVCKIRRSKLPDPAELGNAGSFFKNPEIPKSQYEELVRTYPSIPGYPTGADSVKVPAGWLIEQCGWKGKQVGRAGVHKHQALVLVNYDNARGEEIKALSEQVQHSVFEKFGIHIHAEVNFV
jgi:UDP-N-acetylmuramate dehydrogenase